MIRKRIMAAGICMLCMLPHTGCGETSSSVYEPPALTESVESGMVAGNDRYTLEWDREKACVLLRERLTGQVWSTIPYEFYQGEDFSNNLSSPLFIQYYTPSDGSTQTAKAFMDCIEQGTVASRKLDDGIQVLFHFPNAEITVPLNFTLRKDSLEVSLRTEEIVESGETKLLNVSVLPYLCAAPNAEDRSGYLVIPAGSGALMYTDEEKQSVSRTFSAEVYGTDQARKLLDYPANEEAVRLPLFGVKSQETALMAILEEGAGGARVDAEAGNGRNGYSTVYATFCLRGFDKTEVARNNYSDADIYAADLPEKAVYTVGYYPLEGIQASYSGMAARYREYLLASGELVQGRETQEPYQVMFLGGSLVKDFTLGIPHETLRPATTFSQAQTIIGDLLENAGQKPLVLMQGIGATGLNPGKIAGDYGFAGQLGGESGYQGLESYCAQQEVPLYIDYDVVRFSQSGQGVSALFDTAKTASLQAAAFYPLKKNVHTEDESQSCVRLLSRSKLPDVIARLIQRTDDRASGISLGSLGQIAYSDYSDQRYYAKGHIDSQVRDLLQKVGAEKTLATSAANGYAAGMSDAVMETPLTNGGYLALDETVPLYAMVFHGYTALYSAPLNLTADWKATMLRAVEAGVSPGFVLTDSYDIDLADSLSASYYGSLYQDNRDTILQTVKETGQYFNRIAGMQLTEHRQLEGGVTKSTFSDGTTVWVNHGKHDTVVQGKTLAAQSFQWEEGPA